VPGEPAPPGFYAPDPYAAWWLWVGLAVFAGVLGWYAWVWWATRERPAVVAAALSGDRVARLRDEYSRQIDVVAQRAATGRISARDAHQRLSVLVRHFVQELSGIRAPTMTLTELTASGARLTPVSEVVEVLYPGEFAPEAADTVAGAAEVAREVVRRWS
jgi:hypothetical protein